MQSIKFPISANTYSKNGLSGRTCSLLKTFDTNNDVLGGRCNVRVQALSNPFFQLTVGVEKCRMSPDPSFPRSCQAQSLFLRNSI